MYLQKVISKKSRENKNFGCRLEGHWRNSRIWIGQRYGSADPDPCQIVTDPQPWFTSIRRSSSMLSNMILQRAWLNERLGTKTKAFSPVCNLSCFWRAPDEQKDFGQWEQLYSFPSAWLLKWTQRTLDEAEVFGQCHHPCGFSPECNFIGMCIQRQLWTERLPTFCRLSPPWILKCSFKRCEWTKDLWHWEQLKGFPSPYECSYACEKWPTDRKKKIYHTPNIWKVSPQYA